MMLEVLSLVGVSSDQTTPHSTALTTGDHLADQIYTLDSHRPYDYGSKLTSPSTIGQIGFFFFFKELSLEIGGKEKRHTKQRKIYIVE